MAEEINRQILQFETRGGDRLEKDIQDLSKQLVRARAETARLTEESRQFTRVQDLSADQLEDAARAARNLARAKIEQLNVERKLSRAIREVADEEERSARAARESAQQARLAGDVESRTRAITGAVGFIGGDAGARIERTANIGAEVLASVEAIGLLKQELPEMTSNLVSSAGGVGRLTLAAGALGVATIGLGVAFKAFQTSVEKSKAATEGFLDVNQRYAEIIATGTRQEVEEAIQANQDRNAALEIEREKLREFIDQAEDIDGVTGALLDLNDALNLNLGGYEDVQNRLKEVDSEISNNVAVNGELFSALQRGATAAADAAIAEEQLAEKRRAFAASLLAFEERRTALTIDLAKREIDWTTEQVDKRLEQIEIERAAIEAQQERITNYYEAGIISADEFDGANRALFGSLEDLGIEEQALNGTIRDAATLREREQAATDAAKEALDERIKSIEDERAAMDKRRDALQKFVEDSVKLEAERGREVVEEAADWARDQIRAQAKHLQDLAKLDQNFYAKRAELLEGIADVSAENVQERLEEIKDFNKESERAAEDHQKRLARIQRNAESDILNAAARLDAVALRAAQKKREQDLEDEQDQYDTEQQRREEDYRERLALLGQEGQERLQDARDRLAELERQHRDERAERIAAFNQKQAEEQADRQLSLQRQREAWAREDTERRDALADQLGTTSDGLDRILTETENKFGDIETVYSDGMSELVAITERELDRARMATLNAVQDAIASSPYADQRRGGPQAPDDFGNSFSGVVASAPAPITTRGLSSAIASGTRAGGGSVSVPIYINGARDPNVVAQAVRREVLNIFQGA